MGRHSHPDEVGDDGASEVSRLSNTASLAHSAKTSAVADLQLVLHNPQLLLRALIAAALPFGCYFAVMVGLQKMSDWALFIGAPMVLSGVLVGALLDNAYSRVSHPIRPVERAYAATAAAPDPQFAEGVSPTLRG
jgi:hypothetical protein